MEPLELPAGVPLIADVEFYAGWRGEERPVRLRLEGAVLEVDQVLERWRRPEGAGFRIRAGQLVIVLREDAAMGLWTAEILGPARGMEEG